MIGLTKNVGGLSIKELAALAEPDHDGEDTHPSILPPNAPRPPRNRVINALVVTVAVGSLVAGAALAFVPKPSRAVVHQLSAWLSDQPSGSAVQVDGVTGKADAKVSVSPAGHRMQVVQDGGTVLVEDMSTHQVSRVDPSQLTVAGSATLASPGTRILAGGGAVYLLDPTAGTVQGLDPATLALSGPVVGAPQLAAPLGDAQVAADGTLWVADNGDGSLVPVKNGQAGAAQAVGAPGDTLLVALAAGRPVVTDTTTATLHLPGADGASTTVTLPAQLKGGSVRQPPATAGSVVPILLTPSNQLVLVDTAHGSADTVTLTAASGDTVDTPLMLGTRVYLPDESSGGLLVYDTAARRVLDPITIGSGAGPIDAFVKDGQLWANSSNGRTAVLVNGNGTVQHVDKDPGDLPGGPSSATSPTSATSTTSSTTTSSSAPGPGPGSDPSAPHINIPSQPSGSSGAPIPPPGPSSYTKPSFRPPTSSSSSSTPKPSTPTPSSKPSSSPSSSPSSTPSPPPLPPPTAPPSVHETAGIGDVVVTFTPVASTNVPISYQLTGAPSSATVSPSPTLPGNGGTYQFDVKNLTCTSTPYVFSVAAVYANGSASTAAPLGALPCKAPGAVSSVNPTTSSHQIDLTWSPATANGGQVTYTVKWSGGSKQTTSTSYSITNLAIDKSYTISVTAANNAGTATAATVTVDLSNPGSYNIYRSWKYNLNLRPSAASGPTSLATFPLTPAPPPNDRLGVGLTVLCQTTGETVTDLNDNTLTGDVWDYVSYNGQKGYVSDLYVDTAESKAHNYNSFSSPLWQC